MISSKPQTQIERVEADAPATDNLAEPLREQTIVWLLEGIRLADIKAALARSWPDADIEALWADAAEQFEQTANADTVILRGWCLEAYRELYRRSVEIGDFPAAMRAVKELMSYSLKCSQMPEPDNQAEFVPAEPG